MGFRLKLSSLKTVCDSFVKDYLTITQKARILP